MAHAFDIFRMCVRRGLDINVFATQRASFFYPAPLISSKRSPSTVLCAVFTRRSCAIASLPPAECWRMRFSSAVGGNTLTTQQPQVNIIRAASQISSGLGGAVHLSSYDEGWGFHRRVIAHQPACQQVIAYETGVTKNR